MNTPAMNPPTAKVSYLDATKARVIGEFKVGDVLPDGRRVSAIDVAPGGNIATLVRPKKESAPASAAPSPAAAPVAPAAPAKKKTAKPTSVAAADKPAEPNPSAVDAATPGGKEEPMKNTTTSKNRAPKAKSAAKAKATPKTPETSKRASARKAPGKDLTDAQVAKLWELRRGDSKKWTYPALGAHFGVSDAVAYRRMKEVLGNRKDSTRKRPE